MGTTSAPAQVFSGALLTSLVNQVELISSAAPQRSFIWLRAMHAPSFILFISGEPAFSISQAFHIPNPLKVSSQKGASAYPGTYNIIKDVMAVGTGVGRASREADVERYEASPVFRNTLHQLNSFWATPAVCVGAGIIAMVIDNRVLQTIACGIGTTMAAMLGWKGMLTMWQDEILLHFWLGMWFLITMKWVQFELKRERAAWYRERRVRSMQFLHIQPGASSQILVPCHQLRLALEPSHLKFISAIKTLPRLHLLLESRDRPPPPSSILQSS